MDNNDVFLSLIHNENLLRNKNLYLFVDKLILIIPNIHHSQTPIDCESENNQIAYSHTKNVYLSIIV